MNKVAHLQFGWHSHVPYVLNRHNYYRDNRREACAKWIFDSVNGFAEYYKMFESVDAFSSFLSISGQAIEQFAALASMDAQLRNYLGALNFQTDYLDDIKSKAISLLENTRRYSMNGRLELIGTGFNHNIMPFLDEEDFLKEIDRTKAIYKEYFGVTDLQGYFPPESCIRKRDIGLYAGSGLRYLVLEDPAYMEVEEAGTGASNGNAFLLTESESASPLVCFHRNRAVSLLSWLREDLTGRCATSSAETRADIRYARLDGSVDRSMDEFNTLFKDAQHPCENYTTPSQFVSLLLGRIRRQLCATEGSGQTSVLLFTDHEYLGGAAGVFPRMHEAVRLLAASAGNPEAAGIEIRFSTLSTCFDNAVSEASLAAIKLKQGSWCSGLMLSDAYEKTEADGAKLYAHGALQAPFANWKSFSYHYQLARQHVDQIAALARRQSADRELLGMLADIDDSLNVACTSCFYGWFPPVYRLIPAFELFKTIHQALHRLRSRFGAAHALPAVPWSDDALAALQGRVTQLKIDQAEGDAGIDRIELAMLCAKNIFYLGQADYYSHAYQFLINASKELDDSFEEATYAGTLFQEPNDPWDLWKRKLIDEQYV